MIPVDVGDIRENFNQGWVKFLAGVGADVGERRFMGKGLFVGALAAQGIVDIHDGEQAGGQRDFGTGQAATVALPVVAFVVVLRNGDRRLQIGDALENYGADLDVGLNDAAFGGLGSTY